MILVASKRLLNDLILNLFLDYESRLVAGGRRQDSLHCSHCKEAASGTGSLLQ